MPRTKTITMTQRNEKGSEIFGTNEMGVKDCFLFAKTMTANGNSLPATVEMIQTIDHLLILTKESVLLDNRKFTKTGRLRKDKDLMSLIDSELGILSDKLNQLN